jgi:hypothetical protein
LFPGALHPCDGPETSRLSPTGAWIRCGIQPPGHHRPGLYHHGEQRPADYNEMITS